MSRYPELPALVKVYAYQVYNYNLTRYMTSGCYATRDRIDKRNASTPGTGVKPWLPIEGDYLEVDPSKVMDGFYFTANQTMHRSAVSE